MDEKVAQNGKRNGDRWNHVLVSIVSAVLAGSGSVYLVFGTPVGQQIVRPDPWTQTQASRANAQLEQQIKQVERLFEEMHQEFAIHRQDHPDITNKYDRRITTLEVQYNGIMQYLERIDKKLDNLSR